MYSCDVYGLADCARCHAWFAVGSFAANYDLKDGFFHVKVAPEFADMLGFRMPLSGEWARYRVIVFGGKSSPFIFCGK